MVSYLPVLSTKLLNRQLVATVKSQVWCRDIQQIDCLELTPQ